MYFSKIAVKPVGLRGILFVSYCVELRLFIWYLANIGTMYSVHKSKKKSSNFRLKYHGGNNTQYFNNTFAVREHFTTCITANYFRSAVSLTTVYSTFESCMMLIEELMEFRGFVFISMSMQRYGMSMQR